MNQPPLLHRSTTTQGFWISGLVCLLTLAGLHFFPGVTRSIPHCALRTFTGIPCPLCGGTRSMLAWSQFDLPGAFRFNPFAGILPVAILSWPILARFQPKVASARFPFLLAAALMANWLYLCLTLPP